MIKTDKVILTGLLLLLAGTLSAQKKIWLFQGKNLNQWTAYTTSGLHQNNARQLFPLDHGLISLEGKSAGYLVSRNSYSNFELTAQFKWNNDPGTARKSNSPNSGLMYLVPAHQQDHLWPAGYQFQIKPGHCGDFILLGQTTLVVDGQQQGPGQSIVVSRKKDISEKANGWNTICIRVHNGHIQHYLNGRLSNEGKQASVSSGRILLQYEGYPIQFRKIKLIVLQ